MNNTSKWKEEREVVTCISLSPSNIILTHSLSFTLMAKTKTRRRRTITTTIPSKATNTTLFSRYHQTEDPWGVFIGPGERGASG